MPVGLPGVLGGAPLQEPANNPTLVADAPFVIPAGSAVYSSVPTAPRAWTLPLLADVAPGTVIGVKNNSAGANAITVSGAGTDLVNDAGAPGSLAIAQAGRAFFFARRAVGAVAASWVSL